MGTFYAVKIMTLTECIEGAIACSLQPTDMCKLIDYTKQGRQYDVEDECEG